MADRPKWAKHVVWFISDDVVDQKYDYPEDGSADLVLDECEVAVKAIMCKHFGHEIEDDQCGIPAHRYCVWCGLRETTLVQE